MKSSNFGNGIGSIAAAAAALVATALLIGGSAIASASTEPAPAPIPSEVAVDDATAIDQYRDTLPVLEQTPDNGWRELPAYIDFADLARGGLVEASVHRLYSADRAEYWVAVTRTSQLCVFAVLDGSTDSAAAASGCVPHDFWLAHGAGVLLHGDERDAGARAEVYLLPHGFDQLAVETQTNAPLAAVAPNLIVFDAADRGNAEVYPTGTLVLEDDAFGTVTVSFFGNPMIGQP